MRAGTAPSGSWHACCGRPRGGSGSAELLRAARVGDSPPHWSDASRACPAAAGHQGDGRGHRVGGSWAAAVQPLRRVPLLRSRRHAAKRRFAQPGDAARLGAARLSARQHGFVKIAQTGKSAARGHRGCVDTGGGSLPARLVLTETSPAGGFFVSQGSRCCTFTRVKSTQIVSAAVCAVMLGAAPIVIGRPHRIRESP
jgi:hypothetical protein